MLSVFWKTLFTSMLFMLMWINIAFAFNVLNIMNPTNVLPDPTNYYFGVSSFIEQFKAYFSDNSMLLGFQDFLNRFGRMIGYYYQTYVRGFQGMIAGQNPIWEIITLLFALVLFTNQVVPMLCMILMGVFYIIYLICFAFEIVLFVIAFFGGAFATPLPSTDWWEYTPTITNLAIIV